MESSPGAYNRDMEDGAPFDVRLSEAREWPATNARSSEPARSLRTLDLRPRVLEAFVRASRPRVGLSRETRNCSSTWSRRRAKDE